jgi:hypothetical protein
VGNDDAEVASPKERSRSLDGPRHRQAVESIASIAPLREPFIWDGIHVRLFGKRRVKGGVEGRRVRHGRQLLAGRRDDLGGDGIVQRREPSKLPDARQHAIVNECCSRKE